MTNMETGEPPSTNLMAGSAPDALAVDVIYAAGDWRREVDDDDLVAAMRAAYRACERQDRAAEVALLLTDDAAVKNLNATWRGKDQPTNVLSFPNDAPGTDGAGRHLGDIALAFETVAGEAREKNIPIRHHAAHLAVHGMLHVLGFDHEDDASAERMETLETAILASIGLPDPYAVDAMSEAAGGALS